MIAKLSFSMATATIAIIIVPAIAVSFSINLIPAGSLEKKLSVFLPQR